MKRSQMHPFAACVLKAIMTNGKQYRIGDHPSNGVSRRDLSAFALPINHSSDLLSPDASRGHHQDWRQRIGDWLVHCNQSSSEFCVHLHSTTSFSNAVTLRY